MNRYDIVVGDKRRFDFLEPYKSTLSERAVYEVTNISTLRSMVDRNLSPFTNIYLVNELREIDYANDLSVDVLIVELTLGTTVVYVPLNRFADTEVAKQQYHEVLIGVKIGFIPVNEDISSTLSDIQLLVRNRLGIESEIGHTVISSILSVTDAEHTTMIDARDTIGRDSSSYMKLYYDLVADHTLVIDKLKAIEEAEMNTRLQ